MSISRMNTKTFAGLAAGTFMRSLAG